MNPLNQKKKRSIHIHLCMKIHMYMSLKTQIWRDTDMSWFLFLEKGMGVQGCTGYCGVLSTCFLGQGTVDSCQEGCLLTAKAESAFRSITTQLPIAALPCLSPNVKLHPMTGYFAVKTYVPFAPVWDSSEGPRQLQSSPRYCLLSLLSSLPVVSKHTSQ